MVKVIGIRREDKSIREKRVPLIPEHLKKLKQSFGLDIRVESSLHRVFSDAEYLAAGARLSHDLSPCQVILGVKEVPRERLLQDKIYLFFSHTIKGQPHNMAMLRRLIELGSTLIDYELIKDAAGRRIVFFSRFAGIAGCIDTLHLYGKRMQAQGIQTPFVEIKPAFQYNDVREAKAHILAIGEKIARDGLPKSVTPVVCGITGYGQVSQGIQEILQLLPHRQIQPSDMPALSSAFNGIYFMVFKEEHMFAPSDVSHPFDLNDYFSRPYAYQSIFQQYIPHLSILLNGIYWDSRYPRLVTKDFLASPDFLNRRKLEIIGDISCDLHGAIECTVKVTTMEQPSFVYQPESGKIVDGLEAPGLVIMAIDILPAELPLDASISFSEALFNLVPDILNINTSLPFDRVDLPATLKNALVVWRGQLTPRFTYLNDYLNLFEKVD